MDPNKLYIANVPADTTEAALRSHFSACGGVLQVDLPDEHQRGKMRGLACVTMTSPAFANAARARLDGVSFAGRVLRVSDVPGDAAKPRRTVTVVQQFREHVNMAYDLDCAGLPLVVRIFPEDGESWRVEARATDADDVTVVAARAPTRAAALAEVICSWNASAANTAGRTLDGDALTTALRDVRAV
jgi:hypothetical protein